MSNIKIVEKICDIMDQNKPSKNIKSYKKLITFVKDRPGHDFRYAIDSSKIETQLKFFPSENLDSGLRKTVNWYLKNIDWIDSIRLNKHKQERLGVV